MTNPGFRNEKGEYNGGHWKGDILAVLNLPVAAGLVDSDHPELAAELNWTTI